MFPALRSIRSTFKGVSICLLAIPSPLKMFFPANFLLYKRKALCKIFSSVKHCGIKYGQTDKIYFYFGYNYNEHGINNIRPPCILKLNSPRPIYGNLQYLLCIKHDSAGIAAK